MNYNGKNRLYIKKMEDDLAKIKKCVKEDYSVKKGDIDRAIELTYQKVTEQWIKKLKSWSK